MKINIGISFIFSRSFMVKAIKAKINVRNCSKIVRMRRLLEGLQAFLLKETNRRGAIFYFYFVVHSFHEIELSSVRNLGKINEK